MKSLVLLFVLILAALFGQNSSPVIRISNCVVALPMLLVQVKPEYPVVAKQTRTQGMVAFDATVTEKGEIDKETINLASTQAHPLLVEAAKAAFVQWKYKPVLLNGTPVKFQVYVEINFVLRPSVVR